MVFYPSYMKTLCEISAKELWVNCLDMNAKDSPTPNHKQDVGIPADFWLTPGPKQMAIMVEI